MGQVASMFWLTVNSVQNCSAQRAGGQVRFRNESRKTSETRYKKPGDIIEVDFTKKLEDEKTTETHIFWLQ